MREQKIEKKNCKEKKKEKKKIEEKRKLKLKKNSNKYSIMGNKLSGFVRKGEFLFHLSAHAYYFLNFYIKMFTRESQVTVMNNGDTPV